MRGVVMFLALTACAGAVVLDAGCKFYRSERLAMPEVTATGDFLRWFNALDAGMLEACR